MPQPENVGTMLSSTGPRACGLCGVVQSLSRAHAPAQVAGNGPSVLRAPDRIDEHLRRGPGRTSEGGMWVRGLCVDCNKRSGRYFDNPYADFAQQVDRLAPATAARLTAHRSTAPPVKFAPGLVARSVLYGMFAINPRLRILFPDLAHDLAHEHPGEGPVRWPDQLELRVGLTHPGYPNEGILVSGIWFMRVLYERVLHHSFADIVFPPLTWSLTPPARSTDTAQFGPTITAHLADASGWLNYGPDRTAIDLRDLTRTLPAIPHPGIARDDSWVELMTRDEPDAHPVVVYGFRT